MQQQNQQQSLIAQSVCPIIQQLFTVEQQRIGKVTMLQSNFEKPSIQTARERNR